MKRFSLILLALFLLVLSGCGTAQDTDHGDRADSQKTIYHSDTSSADCYLCGGYIENLIPYSWGQDNIALFSLNTFDIKPIEINRYDRITGQMIEEYAGTVSFGGSGSKDGGFSVILLRDYDQGYATGSLDFYDDATLDINKAAEFLCADCLNQILPAQPEQCFGVGAIHLDSKEVQIFEKQLGGFGLGDFYIDCNLTDQSSGQMSVLIFYCPIRYQSESD